MSTKLKKKVNVNIYYLRSLLFETLIEDTVSYFQGCLLKLSLDYRISEDGGDWRDDAALEIIVDGKDEGFCSTVNVKLIY